MNIRTLYPHLAGVAAVAMTIIIVAIIALLPNNWIVFLGVGGIVIVFLAAVYVLAYNSTKNW